MFAGLMKCTDCGRTMYNLRSKAHNRFITTAKKHTSLTELTPAVLREFISGIYVSESDFFEEPLQRITIIYNYIGSIAENTEQKQQAGSF